MEQNTVWQKIRTKWQRTKELYISHKKISFIYACFFVLFIATRLFFDENSISIDAADEDGAYSQARESVENNSGIDFGNLGNFWLEIDTENLRIKAPIVEGVTDEKLSEGLGHHRTTAFPDEQSGNVVISGHRWKFGNNPFFKIFEDLDKLEKGDKVSIHYNSQEFIYEIAGQAIVDSDAVEILEKTMKPTLTIYTCTPKYTSFRRLVYTAELKEYKKN